MKRSVAVGTAVAFILASGLVHGLVTGRWRTSTALEEGVNRLNNMSPDLPGWDSEPLPLDQDQRELARIQAYKARRYRSKESGAEVRMVLVCGQPGPIAVHPPTVCYTGAGYSLNGATENYTIQIPGVPEEATFKTAKMTKATAAGKADELTIFWSWGANGRWEAPADGRMEFAREPVLYKLYVFRQGAKAGGAADNEPCYEFIRQFLPKLQRSLFPSPVR